jgi:hypothetical protein
MLARHILFDAVARRGNQRDGIEPGIENLGYRIGRDGDGHVLVEFAHYL